MADNYLSSSDYTAHLGADVHAAAVAVVGTDGLDTLAQRATALVQSSLRNSGYTVPAAADLTDETVRLATAAAFMELVFGLPSISQPLPDNWAARLEKRTLEGVLSGDVQLSLPQSAATAPGGWLMSTSSAQTRPQRSSRDELKGY